MCGNSSKDKPILVLAVSIFCIFHTDAGEGEIDVWKMLKGKRSLKGLRGLKGLKGLKS
jgi:hypothetical protein